MTTNPHMEHGPGIQGLVHNLQNLPPEWGGADFTSAYSPLRLAAITRQADNVKGQALAGLRTVGNLLAVAVQSGECEKNVSMDAGWLVEFLGDIAKLMDTIEHNARHAQEHGPRPAPPAP